MLTVNRLQKGLLGLLGIAAGGRTPPAFDEAFIRPNLDMLPFLGSDALTTRRATATFPLANNSGSVNVGVREGTYFIMVHCAGFFIMNAAGSGRIGLALLNVPGPPGGPQDYAITSGLGQFIDAAPLTPYATIVNERWTPPLILQPGVQVQCFGQDISQTVDGEIGVAILGYEVSL